MNSIWCRRYTAKYYYCRMKNYKIVFIKVDEIILIGFVIDIKLMCFAWNFPSSFSLLLCSLLCCGFNRWVFVVGSKKCPYLNVRYIFRLPQRETSTYIPTKCVLFGFFYSQREKISMSHTSGYCVTNKWMNALVWLMLHHFCQVCRLHSKSSILSQSPNIHDQLKSKIF